MNLEQLDLLDDIIMRYRRHLRILGVLKSAGDCVPADDLELWESQIHCEFESRFASVIDFDTGADNDDLKNSALTLCKL